MSEFKFVCRQIELDETLSSLTNNELVLLHSQNNSGLTHFLKKLMQSLWNDNSVCFYIDSESNLSISNQIIGQVALFSKNDAPEQNAAAKLLRKSKKGNIVFTIVSSCLYALDAIPLLPDIGTIANSLISSIKETLDTDYEHLNDFKTEKAIVRFFEILSQKKNKEIYLLIDNPKVLNTNELSFLALLMERYQIHILFAFNSQERFSEMELVSKLSSRANISLFQIDNVKSEFRRPDNLLIEALYQCYGKEFHPSFIPIFDRANRDIHAIMAHILGISLNLSTLDSNLQYLLKVLFVLGCPVPEIVLFPVLRAENLRSLDCSDSDFQYLAMQAAEQGYLKIHQLSNVEYELNLHSLATTSFDISFAERQKIIGDAIAVMDPICDSLSTPLLELAIANLEHDYSHSKQYILALMKIQSKKNCVNLAYLNKLSYFESANELFYVCGIYYDCGIYDKPYHLLQSHRNFSRKQTYKIIQALICERLHIDDYVEKLEYLLERTKTREKKCLLAAILFVAYLNSDYAEKYKCFLNPQSNYYYQSFEDCRNYYYLLRNITYYIEDISDAISNYKKCLDAFYSKDPVNYNRTMSNFLCYLMRHDFDLVARSQMEFVAQETKKILDYNDATYAYLNNNYGIYLMRYTEEDPTAYFSSIPYSAGTTETPYIYAQINMALYNARLNPRYALKTMNAIEHHVKATSVPRTKQFYNINRALIEFVNGIFPETQLQEILAKPLRGNESYARNLYERYSDLRDNSQTLDAMQYKELSLPGYLFYRYFKAEKLLTDF